MKKYYAVIDVETDGTSPDEHQLLEVACVMLDSKLRRIGEFNELVTPCGPLNMSSYVEGMHKKSGLLKDLEAMAETQFYFEVDEKFQAFLERYKNDDSQIILVGNSIGSLDIPFIRRYMRNAAKLLHYRSIDVSGMREGMQVLLNKAIPVDKVKGHRAMQDIEECIAEFLMLKRYLKYPRLYAMRDVLLRLVAKVSPRKN